MRIQCLQHVPFEGPAAIDDWARDRGISVNYTRFYESHTLPDIAAFDLLVVMGGPMSVNDEGTYKWLQEEKYLISKSIGADKAVLGICLGAQLIASALGARVYRNEEREIGWLTVEKTEEGILTPFLNGFPKELTVLQWHGETFDLPANAVPLFWSDACEQQAFLYSDRVLALQFHMEATQESLKELVEHARADLASGTYVQKEVEIIKGFDTHGRVNHSHLNKILTRLEKAVSPR
jgi:GMP synthase-like glutamine amidotransferase